MKLNGIKNHTLSNFWLFFAENWMKVKEKKRKELDRFNRPLLMEKIFIQVSQMQNLNGKNFVTVVITNAILLHFIFPVDLHFILIGNKY